MTITLQTTVDDVSSLLERTADYISTHRWGIGGIRHTGPLGTKGDCPCALESLAIVANDPVKSYGVESSMSPVHLDAYRVIEDFAGSKWGTSIIDVNDIYAKGDKRKIVRAFRAAARNLRKQVAA